MTVIARSTLFLALVLSALTLHLTTLVPTTLAQSCGNGDLRLRGTGSTRLQGRMEVCYDNTWGTVCQTNLGLNNRSDGTEEAMVACRQLGLSDQGAAITLGTEISGPMNPTNFGEGTGPIHLDLLVCDGDEGALTDCSHNTVGTVASNCNTHMRDTGVICAPLPDCIEGAVQLVDGSITTTSIEGRVEVCLNQSWSTVLDSNWGDEEAMVVCGQLGHADRGARAVSGGVFGMGIGPILDIQCTGNEDSLDLCSVSYNDRNYDHSNDAGVACLPRIVSDLCTNQSVFNSVCNMDSTTDTGTGFTCPTGTTSNNAAMGGRVVIVLGALFGVTVIILIGVVVAWIVSCIVMKKKLNDAVKAKNTYTLKDGSETTYKEFKNPTYETSKPSSKREGNGSSPTRAPPVYAYTEVPDPKPKPSGGAQQAAADPNSVYYSTADNQQELTYDVPDHGPNGVQGVEMYGTLEDDRSGPEGPIQSRPRENVDMSNVDEYGKLKH